MKAEIARSRGVPDAGDTRRAAVLLALERVALRAMTRLLTFEPEE
jgi:hypothetical protein